MTEIEKAISIYEDNVAQMKLLPDTYEEDLPRFKLILDMLKNEVEKSKGCEYCSAPYNYNCTIRTQKFNDGAILAIYCGDNKPYIHASCYPNKGDATRYSFAEKIKYCPMCGRELDIIE